MAAGSKSLMDRSTYGWFFRYKIYHLPFWFLYHYLWWSLRTGSFWETIGGILYTPYSIKFAFYVLFQVIGVYFTLYFLIPRFLEKGRYIQFIGLLLMTV